MRRDKTSSKQSEPTTMLGRQVAYDREICLVIWRRFLLGEDLRAICARPPMPIPAVFLGWVQHHQEAREIDRCARNFRSDRSLAKKELGVPWIVSVGDWSQEVRAKLESGLPVDYIDRKYIPPDWNKVYPSLGYPPVRSTEDMRSYNIIINDFTQMLEPRDLMELIWTKEAADAAWKANRLAREKTGSRAGSGHYQALDIAQSHEIKRRDNALRQIARWRDGLGGKGRGLPDKFLPEQALAERYGVAQSHPGAATDDIVGEAIEAAPPLARVGAATGAARPVPLPHEGARAAPPRAPAGDAVEAAQPVAPPDQAATDTAPLASAAAAAKAAPPLAPAGAAASAARPVPLPHEAATDTAPLASAAAAVKAAPPLAPVGTAAGAARPVPLPHEGARAAPPRAPAGDAVEAAQPVAPPDQAATDASPLASAAAAVQAAPPFAPPAPAAGDARPVPLPHQAARAAPSLASAGAAVQAAPPFVPAGETAGAAPPLRASEQAAEAALPLACSDKAAETSEAA
jgi:hypothetical protein